MLWTLRFQTILLTINYKITLRSSSLFEAVLLALVPEVRLGTAQVDDLGTAIPVLLHLHALLAVVGIRYPWASAYRAPSLEGTEVAFITNLDEAAGPDIGVADDALTITLFAKPADSHAWLFSAEYEVWVMLRHYLIII